MLLTVEQLRVSYGRIKALHGIDFSIDEGEIVCIIGANGAGKSTTLRAISRMIPVEPGSKMTFMGEDLLRYPADRWSPGSGFPMSPRAGDSSGT